MSRLVRGFHSLIRVPGVPSRLLTSDLLGQLRAPRTHSYLSTACCYLDTPVVSTRGLSGAQVVVEGERRSQKRHPPETAVTRLPRVEVMPSYPENSEDRFRRKSFSREC